MATQARPGACAPLCVPHTAGGGGVTGQLPSRRARFPTVAGEKSVGREEKHQHNKGVCRLPLSEALRYLHAHPAGLPREHSRDTATVARWEAHVRKVGGSSVRTSPERNEYNTEHPLPRQTITPHPPPESA